MAELEFAESYFDTIAQIGSKRVQQQLLKLLELMQSTPTFGSKKARASLKGRFGDNCMVADLSPFLLVFEYCEDDDVVRVCGIVHRRSIE